MQANRPFRLFTVLLLALAGVAAAGLWLRDTQEGLPEASAPPHAADGEFLTQQDAIAYAIAYCNQGHLAVHGEAQVARAELALPGSERMQEWLGTVNHA